MTDVVNDIRPEVEDEVTTVAHAGEMPEVARAEALFYLTEDPEGPGLTLTPAEVAGLDRATVQAYVRLLRRDLNYRTVGRRAWRGLNRAGANFYRATNFINRHGLDRPQGWSQDLVPLLEDFLNQEQAALDAGQVYTLIPPGDDLPRLAEGLGLSLEPWAELMYQAVRRPWLDFGEVWWLRRVQGLAGVVDIEIQETEMGPEVLAVTSGGDSVRLACWSSGLFEDYQARAALLIRLVQG